MIWTWTLFSELFHAWITKFDNKCFFTYFILVQCRDLYNFVVLIYTFLKNDVFIFQKVEKNREIHEILYLVWWQKNKELSDYWFRLALLSYLIILPCFMPGKILQHDYMHLFLILQAYYKNETTNISLIQTLIHIK